MRRIFAAVVTIGLIGAAAVGVALASHGSESH